MATAKSKLSSNRGVVGASGCGEIRQKDDYNSVKSDAPQVWWI